MADFKGQLLGRPLLWARNTPTFTNFAVDAATDGIGAALQAIDANPITHIGFRVGARVGTPPTYIVGLESQLGTTGFADGTYLGGGTPASATFTPPADTTWDGTWQWVALANAYTPTRGETIAPTIRYSSGTIDASNHTTFTNEVSNLNEGVAHSFPVSLRLTAGTWTMRSGAHSLGIRTASTRYGNVIQNVYITRSASTVGLRQAIKFTLPAGSGDTKKILGFRFIGSIASGAGKNPIAGLWDATTVIQNVTLDSDRVDSPTTQFCEYRIFFDEVTLTSLVFGTAYYLGLEVADATAGGVLLNGIQLASADDIAAYAGGSDFIFSTWNGSAWADDATVRPMVEFILDDVTEPTGGGGMLVHPGMGGGMRG